MSVRGDGLRGNSVAGRLLLGRPGSHEVDAAALELGRSKGEVREPAWAAGTVARPSWKQVYRILDGPALANRARHLLSIAGVDAWIRGKAQAGPGGRRPSPRPLDPRDCGRQSRAPVRSKAQVSRAFARTLGHGPGRRRPASSAPGECKLRNAPPSGSSPPLAPCERSHHSNATVSAAPRAG